MKVALIVTTYNYPSALKKTIEGLCQQTQLPHEIIIADDGSGKDTGKVIKEFIKKAPFRVIHVWQEDKGFRAARIKNKAIKMALGEYLIFLDGDCLPNKYFVDNHLYLAEKGVFIQGKRCLVSRKLTPNFTYSHANDFLFLLKAMLKGDITNAHHIFRLNFNHPLKNKKIKAIKGCNMSLFKKDLLAVNGFNEAFEGWGREDSELAVRLYNYGLKRKEHPFMAICYHLWHSMPSKNMLKKNDELLQKAINSKLYFCPNGIIKE
jgi:glycosyltransferase involved in cell wall biosynthesis